MANQRILVIEDDDDIRDLLRVNLTREGFQVFCAPNGEEGLRQARVLEPDLVLLDLMLPGMNGLDVCRTLKNLDNVAFPVIMVTARGDEHDIVLGLEMGADDYVVKPFSVPVLMARVRRALSRKRPVLENAKGDDALIEYQGFQIDARRHEVRVEGVRLELTSSEFALLQFLVSHPGWVYTRSQIVKAVHGDDYPVTERSVDVMVLSLRRKLGEAGEVIETVRGVGYRFAER
jgi:two-component system, OmpR family, alkaline phosphatase synthesis response regulator PhoP